MSYHEIEPDDKEFLEECPVCEKGYMVPVGNHWYQCSECGIEAELIEGLLYYDSCDLEPDLDTLNLD